MNIIRKIIAKEIDFLFETFYMDNDKKSFTPTDSISKIAKNAIGALDNIRNNNRSVSSIDANNNQGSGIIKAKQLANKEKQSFVEMKRLKAFFDSNESLVNKERTNLGIIQKRKGSFEEMVNSNILLVWNLHGGDPCKTWVNEKLQNTHDNAKKEKDVFRKAGGANKNNGMGVFNVNYDPSQKRIHR